jgi:hypothetical protein
VESSFAAGLFAAVAGFGADSAVFVAASSPLGRGAQLSVSIASATSRNPRWWPISYGRLLTPIGAVSARSASGHVPVAWWMARCLRRLATLGGVPRVGVLLAVGLVAALVVAAFVLPVPEPAQLRAWASGPGRRHRR